MLIGWSAAGRNLARSCGQAGDEQCSTSQSSYASYWTSTGSGLANDGNHDLSSWTHTESLKNSWWRVDFGISQNTVGGTIWNRGDCCPSRLDGFKLWIGDNSEYNGQGNTNCFTATTFEHDESPFTHSFTCIGHGRYFFVHLPSENPLSLAEVEVQGRQLSPALCF